MSIQTLGAEAGVQVHIGIEQHHIEQVELSYAGVIWGTADSALFEVTINDQLYTAQSRELRLINVTSEVVEPGRQRVCMSFVHAHDAWSVEYFMDVFTEGHVVECWLEVSNQSAESVRVSRMFAWAIALPIGAYDVLSYTGAWGSEFEPVRQRLVADCHFEVRTGRSTHGMHPLVTLWRDGRVAMLTSVAWSGNWAIQLAQQPHGAFHVRAGINPWAFWIDVAPQSQCTSPTVVTTFATDGSVDTLANQLATVGRQFWYPRSPLADAMPVEWNHWWTYEDRAVNETVFRQNVDVAAHMGFEVCVVDAGWFGPADPDSHWYDYRGDWHLVNTLRFPSGMRALSDYVHDRGMAFGIWCEIEALGVKSEMARLNPDIVARRDGMPAGYVCLGSEAGWSHAYATLDRIIGDYNADWVKLDFNLDPGAGCNRCDHGHGAGDGLYAHYQGYYRLLTAIRAKYPHVILENCSSGGLRIDLGIAKQTHMAFLSDPDWPEHSLQLFWGASTLLAPDAILHWGFGEWGFADHPQQTFDPRNPALTPSQLDYYTRISMLHRFGFSQALPDLPEWVQQRYVRHIADYQQTVRRFLRHAHMHRLTNQPRRDGTWDRFAGFQFVMPDDNSQMLLCLFRMPDAKASKRFYFAEVDAQAQYRCTWLGDDRSEVWSGAEMAGGVVISDLDAPGAAFILCERLPSR
jgi:alpha-galactosidase